MAHYVLIALAALVGQLCIRGRPSISTADLWRWCCPLPDAGAYLSNRLQGSLRNQPGLAKTVRCDLYLAQCAGPIVRDKFVVQRPPAVLSSSPPVDEDEDGA